MLQRRRRIQRRTADLPIATPGPVSRPGVARPPARRGMGRSRPVIPKFRKSNIEASPAQPAPRPHKREAIWRTTPKKTYRRGV